VLPELDVLGERVLCWRDVRRLRSELRLWHRHVFERELRDVRQQQPSVLRERVLLLGVGDDVRDEPLHDVRRQRAAMLRWRVLQRRRLLRSIDEDVRRERRPMRWRPGQLPERRVQRGHVRRARRSVLRR
jgi:hypothetical protein